MVRFQKLQSVCLNVFQASQLPRFLANLKSTCFFLHYIPHSTSHSLNFQVKKPHFPNKGQNPA